MTSLTPEPLLNSSVSLQSFTPGCSDLSEWFENHDTERTFYYPVNQQQPGVCVHLRTLAAHKNPNDTGAYRYRCSSSAVRSRWQQHQGASGTIRTAVFSVTRALKWTSAASVSQSQLPLAFNKHLHEQKAVFVSFCGGGPPPLCVRFCHFAFAFLNLCQWHQHEVYPDQVGKDVGHVPRHTWKQVED